MKILQLNVLALVLVFASSTTLPMQRAGSVAAKAYAASIVSQSDGAVAKTESAAALMPPLLILGGKCFIGRVIVTGGAAGIAAMSLDEPIVPTIGAGTVAATGMAAGHADEVRALEQPAADTENMRSETEAVATKRAGRVVTVVTDGVSGVEIEKYPVKEKMDWRDWADVLGIEIKVVKDDRW